MTDLSDDAPATAPATALRLARLHLRTGMVRLARLELEQLAGVAALDSEGILDLAEARWRTGDLRGAAEAAGAWLDAPQVADAGATGRSRAMAHAIVADGLTVRGRHEDAALHVTAALDALAEGSGGTVEADLDDLFAGIPARSDTWPAFGQSAVRGDVTLAPGRRAAGRPAGRPAERTAEARPEREEAEPTVVPPMGPTADDTIAAATERLRARDDTAAAVLLVLALRTTPTRADEILQRADNALAARPGAALLLARAEALQALGRTEAAAIAYAVADAQARRGEGAPTPTLGPGAAGPIDAPPAVPSAASPSDPEWSSP